MPPSGSNPRPINKMPVATVSIPVCRSLASTYYIDLIGKHDGESGENTVSVTNEVDYGTN